MLTLNIVIIWFIQLNASVVTAVKPQCSMLYIMISVLALVAILISQTEACDNQDLADMRFLEHGRKTRRERM
jgi:hypothetical protein